MRSLFALSLTLAFVFSVSAKSAEPNFDILVQNFRETLAALVKADTTNPPGNESRAVAILAARLKKEGIPYEILEFAPGRQNLVARLKGTGKKKPLLLLAHIDVVGTRDQNWSTPPHELTEKDGYLYGRGTFDDLGSAAINLETFVAIKKSGAQLQRDLILAYTGDEESGGDGIRTILEKRPELIDAEIAINEGGGLRTDESGNMRFVTMQIAEKIYRDYTLIAKGPTGHSSIPVKDNSIYRLAKALARLSQYSPQERLIPATRGYFEGRSQIEKGPLSGAMLTLAHSKSGLPNKALLLVKENPIHSSMLATTCVATMLSGGTKVNALPPEARANVNCRILPDETPEQVRDRIAKIIQDPKIEIQIEKEFGSAASSSIDGEIPVALKKLVQETWPNTPVFPFMHTAATDSRFLRMHGIQAYGFMPIPMEEREEMRAHGIDERIKIAGIKPGMELFYRLVTRLTTN